MSAARRPEETAMALASRGPVEAIVIGASAGGIEALTVLLPALTPAAGVVVLVVLHLPRDRRSLLVEIFGPRCSLRVQEAQDKQPLEAGTIYFAPPDYHLLIDAGPRAALSVDGPVNYSRPSVDVLFESAADIFRSRLMGIVLTGGNQDGAAGLEAVHRCGGITVVQDPQSAQASFMPASALARVQADFVLTLTDMVALLGCVNKQGGMN